MRFRKGGDQVNNIQVKRNEVKLKQEDIARALDIDRSTVAKWETGRSLPRAERLVKLAKVLGCSIDELMRG